MKYLGIGIAVVVLLLVGITQLWFRRKQSLTHPLSRRDQLMDWAQLNGLSFDKHHNFDLAQNLRVLQCCRQGVALYTDNVITGSWGGRFFASFDFYFNPLSKNPSPVAFSAVTIQTDWPLEPLIIRPEGNVDRFKDWLGYNDIDFELFQFSERFCVQAQDRKWAFDVIQKDLMELLLAQKIPFYIELGWYYAIAVAPEMMYSSEAQAAAEFLTGLLDGLPEYVIEQQIEKEKELPEEFENCGESV